ncbi:isoleucine N-monooxygenase 2 [Prunus yedoensis var. nudiflora]|uniref:Isoleucine N-monooxygenase 2 n=1 Tax=Prunus yedoensis var. nudiflora TaxID=2094558 RepID=A0A314YW44_PRUYE|nr:isoleucine N-monooxygenase 2 [Prunus yedoensis var. nudiflora]
MKKLITSAQNGAVVNVRIAAQFYSGSIMRKMIFNRTYFGKGSEDGGPGVEERRTCLCASYFAHFTYAYAFCISDYLPWLRVSDIDGHEKKLAREKFVDTMLTSPCSFSTSHQLRDNPCLSYVISHQTRSS